VGTKTTVRIRRARRQYRRAKQTRTWFIVSIIALVLVAAGTGFLVVLALRGERVI
jgi:type VI protein secretion system component VasF